MSATGSHSISLRLAARKCDSPGENRESPRRCSVSSRPAPRIAARLRQAVLSTPALQSAPVRLQRRRKKYQSVAPCSEPFSCPWVPPPHFVRLSVSEITASIPVFGAVRSLRIYAHVSDFPCRIFEDFPAK